MGEGMTQIGENKLIVGAGHAREWIAAGDNRGHGPLLQPKNRPGHQALRKGRVSLPNHVYLITVTTLNRQCFFAEFNAGCVASPCFENEKILGDARMLAWVLMPDHAHWLVNLGYQDSLGIVVNRLKSSSSRLANLKLDRRGMLWEQGYHDHALRAEEDLLVIARYIIANPLRAGLVQRIGDYPFWNAIWV
jgi:REP element-mobilizing transposase RayT